MKGVRSPRWRPCCAATSWFQKSARTNFRAPWGRHPLLGRMYLPAYRAGTERVANWRRRYPARRLLPVLYGCNGLVDITTVESVYEATA